MKSELDYIKKHYGEKFSHLCRDNFSEILETEGELTKLITKHFLPSKKLYLDIEKSGKIDDFVRYIKSQYETNSEKSTTTKSPEELMALVGYRLYPECKTEADIQSFRHYYFSETPTPIYNGGHPAHHSGEELCTFKGGRLNSCRVWFAVKNNADQIKREDFKNPNRQDAYGTSVISIQFTRKEPSILSIKNRYNHSVSNSDSTFGNNLDAIAEGLTDAFCQKYKIHLLDKNIPHLELDGYTQGFDGKYYKYNFESGNTYFCPNNIVVDEGEVKVFDPKRYLLFDRYVLDIQEKTVQAYFDLGREEQGAFVKALGEIEEIKRIPSSNGLTLQLTPVGGDIIEIKLNENNEIIFYRNPNVEQLDHSFFYSCHSLVEADFPKLKTMKNSCFYQCPSLKKFSAPLLETIENNCFHKNQLVEIDLPSLKDILNYCFYYSPVLTKFSAPLLEKMGRCCLQKNQISELYLPSVISMEQECLLESPSLTKLFAPLLQSLGKSCFKKNQLVEIDLPSIIYIEGNCFHESPALRKFSAPELEFMGRFCFECTNQLVEVNSPKLQYIGMQCFYETSFLKKFYAPELVDMEDYCFYKNQLEEVDLPILKRMGSCCFHESPVLKKFSAPELQKMGGLCLEKSQPDVVDLLDKFDEVKKKLASRNKKGSKSATETQSENKGKV